MFLLMWERNIDQLPPKYSLTGDWTHNLLLYGMTPQPGHFSSFSSEKHSASSYVCLGPKAEDHLRTLCRLPPPLDLRTRVLFISATCDIALPGLGRFAEPQQREAGFVLTQEARSEPQGFSLRCPGSLVLLIHLRQRGGTEFSGLLPRSASTPGQSFVPTWRVSLVTKWIVSHSLLSTLQLINACSLLNSLSTWKETAEAALLLLLIFLNLDSCQAF